MDRLARYRKAIAAYLIPPLVAAGAAVLPDSPGGGAITPYEWIAIAVAGISCGTVVLAVPNKPKTEVSNSAT